MRSGAVRNRTYRAWENIALPKYLVKLHETAPTGFELFYGTRLRYAHRVASLPPGSTLRIAANPTSIAS